MVATMSCTNVGRSEGSVAATKSSPVPSPPITRMILRPSAWAAATAAGGNSADCMSAIATSPDDVGYIPKWRMWVHAP
jgi:hypothetical protein